MVFHLTTIPLSAHEVKFLVECLPEDTPVRGNAMASGDDSIDRATEENILSQLDEGNDWAWCCVKVTAIWNGLHGEDYLGCCSYESREDFEASTYCYDMKEEALANLNRRIAEHVSTLEPVIQIS